MTHGGVLDILYRKATGWPLHTPRDFVIPNCALNWFNLDGQGWHLETWADRMTRAIRTSIRSMRSCPRTCCLPLKVALTASATLPYWHEVRVPRLRAGRRMLVISRGNTLCGLVMHIEQLSADAMEHVEIAPGVPLIYRFSSDIVRQGKEWLD